MIENSRPLYFCVKPKGLGRHIKELEITAAHKVGRLDEKTVFWPTTIDTETINPKNFIKLKKKYSLDEILIIDRIIGTNGIKTITNHVNRSGKNFLRGRTPEGEFPQFPDMSKIYQEVSGYEAITVHTLGQERFQNPPIEKDVIWSELIGLIAPVAHYVGIHVTALGSEKLKQIYNLFEG